MATFLPFIVKFVTVTLATPVSRIASVVSKAWNTKPFTVYYGVTPPNIKHCAVQIACQRVDVSFSAYWSRGRVDTAVALNVGMGKRRRLKIGLHKQNAKHT